MCIWWTIYEKKLFLINFSAVFDIFQFSFSQGRVFVFHSKIKDIHSRLKIYSVRTMLKATAEIHIFEKCFTKQENSWKTEIKILTVWFFRNCDASKFCKFSKKTNQALHFSVILALNTAKLDTSAKQDISAKASWRIYIVKFTASILRIQSN